MQDLDKAARIYGLTSNVSNTKTQGSIQYKYIRPMSEEVESLSYLVVTKGGADEDAKSRSLPFFGCPIHTDTNARPRIHTHT